VENQNAIITFMGQLISKLKNVDPNVQIAYMLAERDYRLWLTEKSPELSGFGNLMPDLKKSALRRADKKGSLEILKSCEGSWLRRTTNHIFYFLKLRKERPRTLAWYLREISKLRDGEPR